MYANKYLLYISFQISEAGTTQCQKTIDCAQLRFNTDCQVNRTQCSELKQKIDSNEKLNTTLLDSKLQTIRQKSFMLDLLVVRKRALQMTINNLKTMISGFNATIMKLESKLANKESYFKTLEFQNGDKIKVIENYESAGDNPLEITDFSFRLSHLTARQYPRRVLVDLQINENVTNPAKTNDIQIRSIPFDFDEIKSSVRNFAEKIIFELNRVFYALKNTRRRRSTTSVIEESLSDLKTDCGLVQIVVKLLLEFAETFQSEIEKYQKMVVDNQQSLKERQVLMKAITQDLATFDFDKDSQEIKVRSSCLSVAPG